MKAVLDQDQAEKIARAIATVRASVGVACLCFPSLARAWVGAGGATPEAKVLSRSLAARDLALGFGTARSSGAALRQWALLSAFSDAVDAGGTLLARRGVPRRRRAVIGLVSAVAAAAGSLAAISTPAPGPGPS